MATKTNGLKTLNLAQLKHLYTTITGNTATAANAKQSLKGDYRYKQTWVKLIEHLSK